MCDTGGTPILSIELGVQAGARFRMKVGSGSMNSAILGIGTALPLFSITQAEAVELVQTFSPAGKNDGRLLKALYHKTRVKMRGSVLLENPAGSYKQSFFEQAVNGNSHGPTTQTRMERYAKEAPFLALKASQQALDESGLKAGQITHLITVSCTGFNAPGFDIELIKKLGLSLSIHRTHVGFMGCHGALNGLNLAKALVDAYLNARVLLCAVELCSLHFQYGWDSQKVVANSLFADGAAACVVAPAPKAPKDAWRIAASGAGIFPDCGEAMTWKIGDHGFEMTLSPRIPDLIASHLPLWCENWLRENGSKISDIGSWAIHPGGPRILDATAECLNLTQEMIKTSREVLAACGNMSSPTILFILRNLMLEKAPKPCVALGFGPGLSVEAALFS